MNVWKGKKKNMKGENKSEKESRHGLFNKWKTESESYKSNVPEIYAWRLFNEDEIEDEWYELQI